MKGKKGFGSGEDWNGYRGGRTKIPDFRSKFTQELLEANFEDAKHIVGSLVRYCKDGEQWALKLYCSTVLPYMLIKPKTEVDIGGADSVLSETTEVISQMSPENRALFDSFQQGMVKLLMKSKDIK
jgi:hypothetical protein